MENLNFETTSQKFQRGRRLVKELQGQEFLLKYVIAKGIIKPKWLEILRIRMRYTKTKLLEHSNNLGNEAPRNQNFPRKSKSKRGRAT